MFLAKTTLLAWPKRNCLFSNSSEISAGTTWWKQNFDLHTDPYYKPNLSIKALFNAQLTLESEAAICCISYNFAGFCHEQESCLFPKWLRFLVKSESTPVLCVEARHNHLEALDQYCYPVLHLGFELHGWIFHICFTPDKALPLIREPDSNGWCLSASGTVKLLTIVVMKLVLNLFIS